MNTYKVTVTRGDGVWVVDVAGLPDSYFPMTQVARFSDLGVETRDLIAGLIETEPDEFDIEWTYVLGSGDATGIVGGLRDAERALTAAEARRDQARSLVIAAAKRAGLSERVVADVLGVSHQRVNQLVKAHA